MKWERLITVVIPFLSIQEPLGHQEGLTQRQMESKGSFPAKRKTLRRRHHIFTSLTGAVFMANGDPTGEHQDGAGLSILRNCTFQLTSTSVYFHHMRRCREGKMLSQTPVSSVCLFVSLWEERDFFGLWGGVWTISRNSANYTPELLFKCCYLLRANTATSLPSCQAGHHWVLI